MQNNPMFKIKNYRIICEIGSGGLGQVFKAVNERTGQTVAVKFLHKKYQFNERFLGIFHREVMIVASLKHKHIVDFIDSNFEPPNCYIVTEFIDGWSLFKLMKTCGRIPPLVALSIVIHVLQGIDYLHLHDTIHSDLSSPNVLVEKSGRCLVTDFGLAARQEIEDYKHYMVGTPGYYSPEHVSENSIQPGSDIYCAALLLYEMIIGSKAVVASKDRAQIVQSMKNIRFDNIPVTDKNLKKMLRKLLKGSLQYNPYWRIKSTEEMIMYVSKILLHFDVRYARYAVRQFLFDMKLTEQQVEPKNIQNIYQGFFKEEEKNR